MAHNLLRGPDAWPPEPRQGQGATIRRDLIAAAAWTARSGRGNLTLHLPCGWHRQAERENLFAADSGPPARAA